MGKYATLATPMADGTLEVLVSGVWVPMRSNVAIGFQDQFASLSVRLNDTLVNQLRSAALQYYTLHRGQYQQPSYWFNIVVSEEPTPGTTI
jgi:hypothetical protein